MLDAVRTVTPPVLWSDARRRRLVSLCAVITGDGVAAEDLAQETLLEAWRNAHKLSDPAGVDRWLAAIARNVCRRWSRRVGRELALLTTGDVPDVADGLDVELELERAELVELLDRALGLLPPTTRAVLVERFVHASPYAEIAARLGLSSAAVSMRISRGKVALRRLLEEELQEPGVDLGHWRETRLWCEQCGRRRLQMRRQPPPGAVGFRCPGCNADPASLSSLLSLANPFFARLVGDLVRPTAIVARTSAWVHSYYTAGIESGQVDCTRCGRALAVRRYHAPGYQADSWDQGGLFAACHSCGEAVSSSVRGLALALPELTRVRRSQRRLRFLPAYPVEHAAQRAVVLPFDEIYSGVRIDVIVARDSLKVLGVHGVPG